MQKANYEVRPNIFFKLIIYVIILKILIAISYFGIYNNYAEIDKKQYEELTNYKNNLICSEVKICYDYYNNIFDDKKVTRNEYFKALNIFDEYNLKK